MGMVAMTIPVAMVMVMLGMFLGAPMFMSAVLR
jgi:hypothetical protein